MSLSLRRHGIPVLVALLAALLMAATSVTPAKAQPSGIYGTSGHIQVAFFVGATNTYTMDAHLAVGVTERAGGKHDFQGRVHFHTMVNGAAFTGGRVRVNVCLQHKIAGGAWQTQGSTCFLWSNYVAGSWWQTSDTLLSVTEANSSEPPSEVRAIIQEDQWTVFKHKNDSGSEMVDMDSATSFPANTP